jgi:predicted PurR-regulated permease PerM
MRARPVPERLRITARSAITAVALLGVTLVGLRLVAASQRVLGWILAAASIAGVLHPLVSRLARRVPRGVAVAVVALATLACVGLVAYRMVDGIVHEMGRLERAAPAAARRLEARGRFASTARDLRLAERTQRFVQAAPERLRGGTPAQALRSAATRGVAFLATGVLSIFFLLHGPRLAAAAAMQIHEDTTRRRVERVALAAFRRGFGYARGTVAMAAIAGLVAFVVGSAANVPGIAPLSLWVALWDMVPLIGAAVGAMPIVVLAGVGHPARAVELAAAFFAYQLVEDLVVQPWLERRTLRVGPFLTVAAGFAGLELYGIGGAVVSLLALSLVVAALDELAVPEVEPAKAVASPARRRGRGRRARRRRMRSLPAVRPVAVAGAQPP